IRPGAGVRLDRRRSPARGRHAGGGVGPRDPRPHARSRAGSRPAGRLARRPGRRGAGNPAARPDRGLTLPPPLLVSAAAVAALLLGMRARVASAAGPAAAARPPAPLRVLARLPSPRALRARLTGGHGDPLPRLPAPAPGAPGAPSPPPPGGGGAAAAAAAPPRGRPPPRAAAPAVAAGLGALGIAGPALWLRSRARERRSAIVRQLPDLLDLLVICAEAGMALEPALRLAVARLPGALTAEIAALVRELDLGT